jgi:hypothetical protein
MQPEFEAILASDLPEADKLSRAFRLVITQHMEHSRRDIELFKANKIKGEFLANISHEFRTPLNSIMGFAQVLRDKPELVSEDKGKRYAENIITGGQRLLNMINDLLYLAKAEADKIQLHIEQATAYGRLRTFSVSCPPSSYPTYPGGAPTSRETLNFSMYSLMSILMSDSSESKRYRASAFAISVFPTPVGPRKMNEPMGRFGSFSPARVRRIALLSFSMASS